MEPMRTTGATVPVGAENRFMRTGTGRTSSSPPSGE